MTARSAVDLPEPDSPTTPTISPGCSARVRSFTAGWSTPPTAKLTLRFSISRRGSDIAERSLQVEAIAQSLAEEVEADDGGADGQRGPEERPEGDADVLLRLVDHDAPVRVRRLGAQAEIAQRGPAHEREADVDAALHDDGCPHAGQDLPVLDVERSLAAGAGRGDVVVAGGIQDGAAHDADELWRGGHAEGEHRLHEAGAEADDDEEREDKGRDREESVDEAHDDLIEAPAVEAGEERDGKADGEAEGCRPEAEGDGTPTSGEHPAQHIAPEAVRAEQMRGAGRGQPVQQVDLGRRVWAVDESEQSDGEGKSSERRATREIEVHARERSGRRGGQIAHGRATRGFRAAWARSASRLAAT